jgi:DNA-binding IclR family transcriptional regulator
LRALSSSTADLSFKEISSRTGIPPSLCAYHLRLLMDRDLVVRSFDHSEVRKEFSFYRISPLGEKVLRFNDSIELDPGPVQRWIRLVSWRNMPRCFVYRGR